MADEAFPRNKSRKQKDADRAEYLGFTRVQVWGTLFLVYTAAFFLLFNYRYLDDLARQRMGTLGMRLLEESTGSYTAFVLLPLVLWWAGFYVVRPVRWIPTVALHISGAVGFSAAHTTLMAMSRWWGWAATTTGSCGSGIPWSFPSIFCFTPLLWRRSTFSSGCGSRRHSNLPRQNCRLSSPKRNWRICGYSCSRISCLTPLTRFRR